MKSVRFSNDYVRKYTTGMPMWAPSFRLIDLVHDGGWKSYNDEYRPLCWDTKTSRLIPAEDDDYWDIVNIYFPKGKWRCTL